MGLLQRVPALASDITGTIEGSGTIQPAPLGTPHCNGEEAPDGAGMYQPSIPALFRAPAALGMGLL